MISACNDECIYVLMNLYYIVAYLRRGNRAKRAAADRPFLVMDLWINQSCWYHSQISQTWTHKRFWRGCQRLGSPRCLWEKERGRPVLHCLRSKENRILALICVFWRIFVLAICCSCWTWKKKKAMSKDITAVLRCPVLEAATVFRESLKKFYGFGQYSFSPQLWKWK